MENLADSHVHTEWSPDAVDGSMRDTCRRATELGLSAVVFTDHVDFTPWQIDPTDIAGLDHLRQYLTDDNTLRMPPLDVAGYHDSLQRCRNEFPTLSIASGIELGEPHRHASAAQKTLRAGNFDRVLGSLHSLKVDDRFFEPPGLFRVWEPSVVVRRYLAELSEMIQASDAFDVLAHIDYPLRYWPRDLAPANVADYEDEFRSTLRLLATGERALEINTRHLLDPLILRWWREAGGGAITFGSDAHSPDKLAQRFDKAVTMARAEGFGPSQDPLTPWRLHTG